MLARLLAGDTPAGFQGALADALDDGDVSADAVRTVLREADAASAADRQLLYEAVAEGGPNAIRVVDDLNDLTPLYRFVDDTGEDGLRLIRQSDNPQTLQQFFELNKNDFDTVNDVDLTSDDLHNLRANLARYAGSGEIPTDRVAQFVKDINTISDEDGVERIVKQLSHANSEGAVDGRIHEARVAAATDRSIVELERELGPKGVDGELDIVFEDGTYGESKAIDASDYEANGDSRVFDLADQIAGWDDGTDLDGRIVELYVKETPNDDKVDDAIEEFVLDETGSEITVDFKSVAEVE